MFLIARREVWLFCVRRLNMTLPSYSARCCRPYSSLFLAHRVALPFSPQRSDHTPEENLISTELFIMISTRDRPSSRHDDAAHCDVNDRCWEPPSSFKIEHHADIWLEEIILGHAWKSSNAEDFQNRRLKDFVVNLVSTTFASLLRRWFENQLKSFEDHPQFRANDSHPWTCMTKSEIMMTRILPRNVILITPLPLQPMGSDPQSGSFRKDRRELQGVCCAYFL